MTPVSAQMLLLMLSGHLLMMMKMANGHPQCLDFRPPFQSSDMQFCSQYADFGCCNATHDQQLSMKYHRILAKFRNVVTIDHTQCRNILRDILCQECSPYAAHIYDAEAERKIRPFPGLCSGYCSMFYDKCSKLIPHITEDVGIGEVMNSKDQFCSRIILPDPDYCFPDWILKNTLNQSLSTETITEEGCLCLEPFAKDEKLRNALSFRYAPDGSGRIFISEQIGVIHIFYKNQTKIPEPFMDLTDVVLVSSRGGDERGFLNMAFHPEFAENGRFYVYFTLGDDQTQKLKIRISEFRVSDNDPNKVNRTSERIIIEVDQPYWNHNGGELLFGVDGYLYAFLGDGGAGGDPQGNAQNKGSLLGSVIRLDVDNTDDTSPYRVPSDNPFVNEPGARPEIYAYGIRNVWRCDVDEGHPETGYGRGRIFCGDVGQNAFEEIDIIKKGRNYGWNSREGFECYKEETCGKIGPEELPIYAYPHSVGKSVTGGHVYRGCMNPNLQGFYIYGDYTNGKVFRLKETINSDTGESVWENRQIKMCGTDVCFNGLVNRYHTSILSFGEDDDGEIYILSTDFASSTNSGSKIYKFVDPRRRGDPTKCRTYIGPSEPEEMTTVATDRGIPPTPRVTSVKVNSKDPNSIDVSWNTDLNGKEPILYYIMQYRIVPSGETLKQEDGWIYVKHTLPPHTTTFTASNLVQSKSYQFRIAAGNTVGVGFPSEPSTAVELSQGQGGTGPIQAVGVPRNLVANAQSTTMIALRWDPPEEGDVGGGVLEGYTVRYKASGAPDNAVQYKRINTAEITAEILTGLETWTKYEVSVAAITAESVGPYSEIAYVWTLEGKPSSSPGNIICAPLNSTGLELRWDPPMANSIHGMNRGYKIRAKWSNTTEIAAEVDVPVNSLDQSGRQVGQLTGLEKYTEYDVTISCYTNGGEGPTSEPLRQRTAQDAPEEVASLAFEDKETMSVRVVWTEPGNINGILMGYTLTYQVLNVPESKITKELPPTTLEYTMTGLRPDAVYTVRVYASTIAGPGPQRAATLQLTTDTPGVIEICQRGLGLETRSLTCGAGQVITKTSAKYGRMNLGRCIHDSLGSVGCGTDVSNKIFDWCLGRKQCKLHDWFLQDWFLRNRIMLNGPSSCPDNLDKYLEITFQCGEDPCKANPCRNNGSCDASEDPYGIGYYCFCEGKFGGTHCQIADPCMLYPCPEKITILCLPLVSNNSTGRVCYGKGYGFIDTNVTPET